MAKQIPNDIDKWNLCKWTDTEKAMLSQIQRRVFELRARKYLNADIKEMLNLKDRHISSCIKFTLEGNFWTPGRSQGGHPQYLSDSDILQFQFDIRKDLIDLDCMKTITAYHYCYDLKEKRYQRAIQLSSIINLDLKKAKSINRAIQSLMPSPPSTSSLYNMCDRNGIIIKNPQSLEEACRKHCNISSIKSIFRKHGHYFGRDPRLIWNADETSSAASKKYKVLVSSSSDIPLSSKPPEEQHITGIFPFNAAGTKMDPFMIINGVQSLPDELKNFECFFASQKSGWVTLKIFDIFCLYFTNKISLYRQQLPEDIRNDTIILLVDNHSSRFTSLGIEYLNQNNIKLITFPSHCTHVLQPFDVSVARALKSRITTSKINKELNDFVSTLPTKAAKARYITIYSMCESWRMIPQLILQNAFKATGIHPLDEDTAVNNKYVYPSNVQIPSQRRYRINTSNEELTTDQNRLLIAEKTYSKKYTNVNQIPKFSDATITSYCKNTSNLSAGFALSDIPRLFKQTGPRTLTIFF